MSKKTAGRKLKPTARKEYSVDAGENSAETARNIAAFVAGPEAAACRVINSTEQSSRFGGHLDLPTLLEVLRDQAAAVNEGSLAQAEAMLMNQATALQSIFARCAERGMVCDEPGVLETLMRIGLRAQAQCRATLETLANIKNPPTVFARQANIAHGPQQVNNGTQAPRSRAGEMEILQNELSGSHSELLLSDARAPQAEGRVDPTVEAVGKIDWAKIHRR